MLVLVVLLSHFWAAFPKLPTAFVTKQSGLIPSFVASLFLPEVEAVVEVVEDFVAVAVEEVAFLGAVLRSCFAPQPVIAGFVAATAAGFAVQVVVEVVESSNVEDETLAFALECSAREQEYCYSSSKKP